MPGIDRQRVVGKTDEEMDEFTCSICHDIYEEPVVTQCCRQSFCTVCIHQWLVDHNICPYDRKRLTVNGLIPAPRMTTNLLNKLNIKCVNYGNGCQSIVRFEEMANHMKTCNTCDSCKTSQKIISEKEKLIERFAKENVKLKRYLDQSHRELRQSKASNAFHKKRAEAINNTRNNLDPIEENQFGLSTEKMDLLKDLGKFIAIREVLRRDNLVHN